ncbi:PBP1A family penicillin-binding protein [Candidatus Daviesbacteria bacterium]|nr:PBP1A family penicillin-binding protein [Candidatus Daviesbacteria bacterium]
MRTLRRSILVAFFAITAFISLIPIITYVVFARDLSPRETLINHNGRGVKLFDRNNKPFFTFYEARFGKKIPLTQIPKITQQTIIAMEDKDFYKHPGFSIPAIIRSFFNNIQGRSLTYGGSTITQQLVKNSLLNPRKDFLRKTQEIILAQEIERRYTKDEILEMYLNSVYFGEGAFGVEEAANIYFSKQAQDLNLTQSAALAGLLSAPSKLSLLNGNLSGAKKRQEIVLARMQSLGLITKVQKEEALARDLEISPNNSDFNTVAPHFAIMVRDFLIEKYGEEKIAGSGINVKTTIDLDWQKFAEEAVEKQVKNLKWNNVSNGAAVVLDPRSGEIKALVGSVNWQDDSFGKVNIPLSLRPPGSSIKPLIYIRAFEKGIITPATILQDSPTKFANFNEDKFFASFPTKSAALAALARDPNAYYSPKDYDRKYRGPVTVRRALANSLNIPAVAVLKKLGLQEALDSAKNLGLTTLKDPSNYGLSLILGTAEVRLLEMTSAYAVFANGGLKNDPVIVLEITDKAGKALYQNQTRPKQVADEKYTFLISSILSDNKTRAELLGTALNISRPAAVKTGTTEDFKDAWTIGYTPSLVVGVWVGNNFGERMDGIAGSLGAAPVWKSLMEEFLKGSPIEQFEPPDGIVKLAICSPAASEYFVKGSESPKNCPPQPPVATKSASLL